MKRPSESPPNYDKLSTEQHNPRSKHLDRLNPLQIATLMNREDRQVLRAVHAARAQIAEAITKIAASFRKGGRLVFFGAGTSGRLGVIEAAECPPTFGTEASQVQGVMAGGDAAVFRSKEGSEDSEVDGARLARQRVRRGDVAVGIAASGVTPFVKAALAAAKRQGAYTVLVTCYTDVSPKAAQTVIVLPTGPEVLTGSTRLKAGTACKMTLNMLTTGAMVQTGKVYGNWMVDLQPKSRKLIERGKRFVRQLGGVSVTEAEKLFEASDRETKTAIVMAKTGASAREARARLKSAKGFLRNLVDQ